MPEYKVFILCVTAKSIASIAVINESVFIGKDKYGRGRSLIKFVVPQFVWKERRGRMINAATSYSGGSGFDSLPRRLVIVIEDFVVLFSPSRRMPG
jgi:hypothetical protein